MMCWADSRHICIRFRTFRDALRDSRQFSGDSKRILRKQNRRGRVARMIHWISGEWSAVASLSTKSKARTWWYWRCKYADIRETPLPGSKCSGNDSRSSSASPAMLANADLVLSRKVRLMRPLTTYIAISLVRGDDSRWRLGKSYCCSPRQWSGTTWYACLMTLSPMGLQR